jgi:hypothetical protein
MSCIGLGSRIVHKIKNNIFIDMTPFFLKKNYKERITMGDFEA